MRFSAPRSTSPSPVRRSRNTFGLPPDSSDEETDASDAVSIASSSTDSFCYASESEVPPPPPKPKHNLLSLKEQHHIEDTVASIRLRVRYRDPYEEFEKDTKREAAESAREKHKLMKLQRRKVRSEAHSEDAKRRAALHQKQVAEVEAQLSAVQLKRQADETKLKEGWKARSQRLWERIEQGIKFEEDKVKARLEVERKKQEEEDRKRREAEEKQRAEEEARRKEEEERQRQKQKEEEEARRQEEADKQRAEQLEAEKKQRKAVGATTAIDDWGRAREMLLAIKTAPMKIVKADKALKSQWSAARREITPKIGQLTNDASSIMTVTQQIMNICRPATPYPPAVYLALLSSLAKTILLQAETEVTAEKRSAGPLAQVTANLLAGLNDFSDVFWAKLCQRAGPWPAPIRVPEKDVDGTAFDTAGRAKAQGVREGESLVDHTSRVAGLMRVYFHILFAPVPRPQRPLFRLPRYWSYFARMLLDPLLLQNPVAPEVLYAALDVGGAQARDIWGAQWVKLLAVLYDGVTTGLNGSPGQLIGGKSPEGIAARVRLQLEIERIMSLPQ